MTKCSLCGSTDFVKKDGALICTVCGAKIILPNKEERFPEVVEAVPSVPQYAPAQTIIVMPDERNRYNSAPKEEEQDGGKKVIIPRLVALHAVLRNIANDFATIAKHQSSIKQKQKEVKDLNSEIEKSKNRQSESQNKKFRNKLPYLLRMIFIYGVGLLGISSAIYLFVKDFFTLPIESTFLWWCAVIGIGIGCGLAGLFIGRVLAKIIGAIWDNVVKGIYFFPGGQHSHIMRTENANIAQCTDKIEERNKIIENLGEQIAELNKIVNDKQLVAAENYGDLIHPSDFGSTDYLLYLFITRRADTVKEALQLLDEQKRTNQLEQRIQESAAYLSKNLSAAVRHMQREIKDELSSIGGKMTEANEKLANISWNVYYY